MLDRFIALNADKSELVGVFDKVKDGWAVEPEYSWLHAQQLAQVLNMQPTIDPDELYRLAEVSA